jgi:hypothetical protein
MNIEKTISIITRAIIIKTYKTKIQGRNRTNRKAEQMEQKKQVFPIYFPLNSTQKNHTEKIIFPKVHLM